MRSTPPTRRRARLDPLDRYSQFATSYRYPSPSGRLKAGPDVATLERGCAEIAALLAAATAEFVAPTQS